MDSTGTTFYDPGRGEAYFTPGGIPFGNGLISVNALISMIRTGFPAVPVQWEMVDAAEPDVNQCPMWVFISSATDTLIFALSESALYPVTSTAGTTVSVSAFSWHDEFKLWPMEWEYSSSSLSAVLKIRSIDEVSEHPSGGFDLVVPVPVDTLQEILSAWNFASPGMIR